MLFSGNFLNWNVFKEREETSLDAELISPAAEVASILNMHNLALLQEQQGVEQEHKHWLDALTQQAVLVVQLALVLERYESGVVQLAPQGSQSQLNRFYRSLRIVKDQMLDALQRNDLEIEVPVGKSFDEVADMVQVEGWRHHQDYTAEVVVEVMEPIVRYRGAILHTGRVVMGAPLKEDDIESSMIS